MADSILRLKVESQEYDAKIKRAAEGLRRYVDVCHQQGDVIGRLLGDTRKYVDSIGQMETVNKTARGSVNELKSAFTEFRHVYNQLSDEEKKGDFGKQLNSQLEQLKVRIRDGENELKSINNEISGGGGLKDALDQVAGKFGLNIDMVTKFGGVVGVTTTALKVAKDAFFQSESNIDEWNRTVKGAEGAYDIFLQTLNNGNWSNFFSNLSQAITGARDLYDAFDRLNSIKANNAVAIATTQAEIQQLRLLKQQGQDVDDKIKAATQRLSALQSQSANAGINAGRSQVINTLRNGVNSIGGAYINDATLNRVADNISKQGQAYFDYMKRRAAALEKQGMVTKTETIMDSQGGTYERQHKAFDINALSKEQQKQYAISKTVTERETEIQKGLTVWSQSVNEQASNAREQFRDNRYALQGSGGGGGRGSGRGGTTTISPSEQAGKYIEKAQKDYADAISNAQQKLVENMMKSDEYDKQILSGQQKLADAYLKAYNETGDEKYLSAFRETATHVKEMQGVVDANAEAQKAAEQAARELEAAQKKLADAENRLAEAQATGSATAIYQAQQAVNKQRDVLDRMKNGTPEPAKPTGLEAMKQTIQAELKFDQMKVDETTLHTLLNTAIQNGLDHITPDYTGLQKRIAQGIDIPNPTWESLQNEINENLKKLGVEPIKINFETGGIENVKKGADATSKSMNQAASAISSVGSALQQIEDPTAKVMGIVAQAIATIALSFADALGEDRSTKSNIWAFIGASAASMGAMISAISQIHSATGYAEGGLIKGNSYSGDNILMPVDGGAGGYAGLNAGEIVLNKAAQGNLASQLQGVGGSMNLRGIIRGEDILVVADRSARRQGKGELLFWK